jgi:hypothetical protein
MSKQWQDLAKPKVGEAIIWTIAETLLGLVPFPIPTTPVTFLYKSSNIGRLKSSNHRRTTKVLTKGQGAA